MWLFTSMTSRIASDISDGGYLGSSVQRLKLQKTKKIHEMLGILSIKRPELSTCNPLDLSSIHRYIARENLECAIYCDPETPIVQVEKLCHIAIWDIKEWEYIHVSIHPNYQKVVNEWKKTPRNLLAYFEVDISNIDIYSYMELQNILEFKRQFEKATTQTSYIW